MIKKTKKNDKKNEKKILKTKKIKKKKTSIPVYLRVVEVGERSQIITFY